jgi:hypothetical protein
MRTFDTRTFDTCSRRHMLAGALSTFLVGSLPASADELPPVCGWDGFDTARYRTRAAYPKVDRALIAELSKIIAVFQVNPGFQYVEDESPNAFALRQNLINGTQGTVLIGLKLIDQLIDKQGGGVSVAGVCAHECAHIYQYFSNLSDHFGSEGREVMIAELHADLLAGYYMGSDRRGDVTNDNIKLFEKTLIDFGTFDYGNPKYHGSPAQRVYFMEHGYKAARDRVNVSDAATEGEIFIRNILGVQRPERRLP